MLLHPVLSGLQLFAKLFYHPNGLCAVYLIMLITLHISVTYRGADKFLARPGRTKANVSVRMARISIGALPCTNKILMTARVSVLLKSRTSLKWFRACFLPGRANDLSAPRKACVFLLRTVISCFKTSFLCSSLYSKFFFTKIPYEMLHIRQKVTN